MDADDLSQLVREINDEGASYQDMADRSAAAGHPVSKPYFQKLGTNAVTQAPTPERLAGIAAGLERPLELVKRAAARQFLEYEGRELTGFSDDVRVIVAHLAGMSTDDARRWRAMIEADERARQQD
ncbi:hypothetical protein [Streptomyces sp. NBC_00842]|uniref:hypothetical protein n=1 Tax=Streptomyces sp. NBC_00842 TaxID=2975848 RepID=UPI0038690B4D|nr:hypothetical protein OH821_21895 [Streptomyces sp. NBC_00842]